jgi:hypothetical protein
MKVYGLDFTSNPSKTKRLTLAHCELHEAILCVQRLECLNSENDGDFSRVAYWLKTKFDGIVGVDFPFGLPLSAIEHFKWISGEIPCWSSILNSIYRECPSLTQFQDSIEGWKRTNKTNNLVKVHVKRQADQIAGSSASSPLKVRDFPPVGSMFYAGARLLDESGACIYPVRINDDERKVVEAYPALAVNRFVGDTKYKDQTGERKRSAQSAREEILRQLTEANTYGMTVTFEKGTVRDECMADHAGDKLDSVLCGLQAAWAYAKNGGVPEFRSSVMKDTVAIEGWIADPSLYDHFRRERQLA